jgi:hypothetical protein
MDRAVMGSTTSAVRQAAHMRERLRVVDAIDGSTAEKYYVQKV